MLTPIIEILKVLGIIVVWLYVVVCLGILIYPMFHKNRF